MNKTITIYDLARLDEKLVALNRKAVRLGLSAVSSRIVSEEKKIVTDRLLQQHEVFSHYEVEISFDYEQVVLPGEWRLVGVIDHTENLVKSVPGQSVSLLPFLERGAVCDHCHIDRQRNETFVLYEPSGYVQVGRTCVGSFLGIDPARVLGQIDFTAEVAGLEDDEYGQRVSLGIPLGFYLSHVAAVIRVAGWRSRSTARDNGTQATADLANVNILSQKFQSKGRYGEELWTEPITADVALAEATVVWLSTLADRSGVSDYIHNLAQIGVNGYVTGKSDGFAASAIVAYQKEQEQEIKRAAEREAGGGSKHVGRVGERLVFVGHKVSSAGYDSEWGYQFYHRFIDSEGNVIVWKTGTELENGHYKVTATVKKHDVFRGELQTNVTRAKIGLAEEVA